MNRLVIIDGNAILHRAYHALPPLTAPDGSVVNAVYGFTSILIKIWNDFKPTHMAVAFDRPAPTFRKTLYKEYQSQRPKMEDDLSSQVGKMHDVVNAFGIPIYEKDGFEADDMIGTLAKKAVEKKIDEVIIVTGDRDLLQLVDDRVKVFMPTKGISEGKLFGEAETKERMGVPPNQIADLKGLMGDASDNYPGVAGIGPKTAQHLLEKFGSVEALYKDIKKNGGTLTDFSEGVVTKLKEGIQNARLSKDLATVRRDAPLDINQLTPIQALDTPQSRSVLVAYNFKSLLRRLTGEEQKKEPTPKKTANKQKVAADQIELFS
jgi:DNA polymerase-1